MLVEINDDSLLKQRIILIYNTFSFLHLTVTKTNRTINYYSNFMNYIFVSLPDTTILICYKNVDTLTYTKSSVIK